MAATLTAENSFLTSLCPHLFYAQQYSRNIYMIYITYNANIYSFIFTRLCIIWLFIYLFHHITHKKIPVFERLSNYHYQKFRYISANFNVLKWI